MNSDISLAVLALAKCMLQLSRRVTTVESTVVTLSTKFASDPKGMDEVRDLMAKIEKSRDAYNEQLDAFLSAMDIK